MQLVAQCACKYFAVSLILLSETMVSQVLVSLIDNRGSLAIICGQTS